MREFLYMTRKRSVHLLGACVLLAGGIGVPVLIGAESAQAACTPATAPAVGDSCGLTGSAALGAGALTLTPPAALAWTGGVTGVDQALVDTTAADETYAVDDATGSGAGWDVTITATTFTNLASATTPLPTLLDSGTLQTNGDVTATTAGEADNVAPTAVCATVATELTTCTLPTDTTAVPVAITTAATTPTAYTIYNADSTTTPSGLGSIVIGGSTAANPVAWVLNVPANTLAGTYTSTVTMDVITAP
jgi:hypothetical protein